MDEPFGALDALTRAHLQDALMAIQAELGNTVITITHDVDEAVLLSDRIVAMTNGPSATVGEILTVDLPGQRQGRPGGRSPLPQAAPAGAAFLYEKQRKVTPSRQPGRCAASCAPEPARFRERDMTDKEQQWVTEGRHGPARSPEQWFRRTDRQSNGCWWWATAWWVTTSSNSWWRRAASSSSTVTVVGAEAWRRLRQGAPLRGIRRQGTPGPAHGGSRLV